MIHEATQLEYKYAVDTMPRGVLGMNAKMFKEIWSLLLIGAVQIGLDILYPELNPFPWMSELMDLKKEKTFLKLAQLSTKLVVFKLG